MKIGDEIKYYAMLPGGKITNVEKKGKILEILTGEDKKLGDYIIEKPDGTREAITEKRIISEFIYQKKFDKKPVQLEFKTNKTTIKPLGKPNKLTPVKKTELNHYGLETSDRPHLESFDVCVDKHIHDLINELEEATSNPHYSVSSEGKRLDEIVKELKTELKKIPVCDEDED